MFRGTSTQAFHTHEHKASESEDPEEFSFSDVYAELKLKYLSVVWKEGTILADCPIFTLIPRLLLEKSSDIEWLKLGTVCPVIAKFLAGQKFELSKLQVLDVSVFREFFSQKDFIGNFMI